VKQLDARFAAEEEAQANGMEMRKDFFHYILRGRDPETGLGFTRSQLNADSGLLIAAGSDGVGLTLAASMFYVLKNPEVYEKLAREVRMSFTSAEEIRAPKINQLPYLHAVFEETMRMTPAVPSALPRYVEKGGIVVDGQHIPEGIDVGVSPYAIHHNEAIYPRSFQFCPDRFLGDKESTALAKKAYPPFSKGAMDCIGRPVAYLALKLALAKLIYTYDIRPAGGKVTGGGGSAWSGKARPGREREAEYQLDDWLIGKRSGPDVQFKVRES